MANRAYLLNTAVLTSDRRVLESSLSQGKEYAVIADAANRIPLPWLCCFNGSPLNTVTVPLESESVGDSPEPLIIELPCIDVTTAKRNLCGSLSIFQEVAGDADIGEGYWRHACDGLADLPLPYLTLNPIEVLFMADPVEVAVELAECIRSPSPPISLLKNLCKPWDGFMAFSAKDFYSLPLNELNNKARLTSSRALDAAYLGRDSFYWHRSPASSVVFQTVAAAGKGQERKPWWKVW